MTTHRLAIVFAVLVILAGCQGFPGGTPDPSTDSPTTDVEATSQTATQTMRFEQDNPSWSLSLLVRNVTAEPGGTFEAYVATGGRHGGNISGVAVQFIAENGTVVSEIPVGNITTLGKAHWANTTIPMVPVYVVPKVEDWNTPESEFSQIQGTYITADGEFRNYVLTDPENFTR